MSMDREELEAMLVFLANDTLEGEERAEVEAAVEADAELSEQLNVLKSMRATMLAEEDIQSPGDFGLARLQREIKTASPAPVAANVNAPRTLGLWRIAAIVAIALFAGQTALMLNTQTGDDIVLAGGEESLDFALRVGFVSTATEGDIRDLLLEGDLVIVDGPTALGFYTLSTPNAESREAAFALLQNRTDLVEIVEELP